MNNEELRLRTWEHKVVGGGRNSRGTTTIAPGLINTNASDIYCDLAQNTMLLRSKRAQLVDARWGRKEQRNRLEHYSEKMEHSQWGPCRHIHNPTETWQCVCVDIRYKKWLEHRRGKWSYHTCTVRTGTWRRTEYRSVWPDHRLTVSQMRHDTIFNRQYTNVY